MSFTPCKRNICDNKTSPLKAISPIIKKYDDHRKRKKINRDLPILDNDEILELSENPEPIEKVILSPVHSSETSPCLPNDDLPDEMQLSVQEICAIAKQNAETKKSDKPVRIPRKRSISSPSVNKKRLQRHSKMMESALEIFKPEPLSVIEAREEAYASNYFQNVKSKLSAQQFDQFCSILEQLETGNEKVPKVFQELTTLLSQHSDLVSDLIPFLTSSQALECGVFMEHLMLTKMADFLSLLDRHFAKTPYQIKRILLALEKLSMQPNITIKEVVSTLVPMLKGQPVLKDYLTQLLPSCRPSEALHTDFDEFDDDAMSDGSDDCCGTSGDLWERFELPVVPDPYGGDTCICKCHDNLENEKLRSRIQHCIPCSTKYINGKVFIQSGKLQRRATISFANGSMEFHRRRLCPGPAEPRKRKRSSCQTSPNKTSQLSSDELKSDDDDKQKSKTKRRNNGKSPGEELLGIQSPLGQDTEVKSQDIVADELVFDVSISEMPSEVKTEPLITVVGSEPLPIPEIPPPKSPPVLSIPENVAIVSPILNVLENELKTNEAWTMEEDKVILRTLQVENYSEETFSKIKESLPSRSIEDIKGRFQELLNILYEMKADSSQ